MAAAARAALAAAVRVIDRVHRDAADVRTASEPAVAAGLAELAVAVFAVADFADGGAALGVHEADFAGRQSGLAPFALDGDELVASPAERHLGAAADRSSTQCTPVASGMTARGSLLPGLMSVSARR